MKKHKKHKRIRRAVKRRTSSKMLLAAIAGNLLLILFVIGMTWGVTNYVLNKGWERQGENELQWSGDGYCKIYDTEDYLAFWTRVKEGETWLKGRLYNDIYLADEKEFAHISRGMENIVYVSEFSGVFDGNGHTIWGLHSESGYGLVASNEGIIKNLVIRKSFVRGRYWESGGICLINNGNIYNCIFYGEIACNSKSDCLLSGICTVNYRTIDRCGFMGEFRADEAHSGSRILAGICGQNESTIKNCYNFTTVAAKEKEEYLAISDQNEINCYKKKDSGWQSSENGQILELNFEQCRNVSYYLDKGLYGYLVAEREETFQEDLFIIEEKKQKKEAPLFVPKDEKEESSEIMETVLQDPDMVSLLWSVANAADFEMSDYEFEKWGGEDSYTISCPEGEIFVENSCKEDCDIQEIWQNCTVVLNEDSKNSWEHDTYRLISGSMLNNGTRIVLYRTKEGEVGFFHINREKICHVVAAKKENEADTCYELAKTYLEQKYRLEMMKRGRIDLDGIYELKKELRLQEEALSEFFMGNVLLTMTGEAIPYDGIAWKDETVKEAVYEALGMTEDSLYAAEEMMHLKELTIYDEGELETLEDLAVFTGLESLWIERYTWEDTAADIALEGEWFPSLTMLSIAGYSNMDPSFLKEFSSLQTLYLIRCGLTDISFVKELPDLVDVSFYQNEITDISSLVFCKKIKNLFLGFNNITDISPLASLSELEELGIQGNAVKSLEPLRNLEHLMAVNFHSNQISDLSPLAGKTAMIAIGAGNNQITDISPLKGMTQLYNLSLDHNRIQDISPLEGMTEMEWLGLSSNQIQNYDVIQDMDQLFYLAVYENPGQDVGDKLLVPWLEIGVTVYEDKTEALSEAQLLLARTFTSEIHFAEDVTSGDINQDGTMDLVITSTCGREEDEDGYVADCGERYVSVFLGDGNGNYTYCTSVQTLDAWSGGIYGDPYQGTAIAGGRLVIQCYGGSSFRWLNTEIYSLKNRTLSKEYELWLNNWTGGTGGYDWYVMDCKMGKTEGYAIVGECEQKTEKLLLSVFYENQKNTLQKEFDQKVADLQASAAGEIPDVSGYYYLPDIGSSYYEYEIQEPLYAVRCLPENLLQEAKELYLPQAVQIPIPEYVTEEIKANYDRLSGVVVPENFYLWLNETGTVARMLVYTGCEETADGYVHHLSIREVKPGEDNCWWREEISLTYYENEMRFEVWE